MPKSKTQILTTKGGLIQMMAAAPLMIEHRLIERMIKLIGKQIEKIQQTNKLDILFIDQSIDFIRTYADRAHHGKEEDILFQSFKTKPLTPEQVELINSLISEHSYARKLMSDLNSAKERYMRGDTAWAVPEAIKILKRVVEFYPMHIAREDAELFLPVMKHYTQEEHDKMLADFNDFDRKMLHEKYTKLVESVEERNNLGRH